MLALESAGRVLVFDGKEVVFFQHLSWLLHERGMKRELGFARFLHRVDLRAQVVGAQEIVRDPQPAGRVAL